MTPPPDDPPDLAHHAATTVAPGEAPRYRVLVTPARSDRPGYGRGTGFVLEVTRVDAAWRREAGDLAYRPLLTTWVRPNHAGALDPAAARAAVVVYLTARSYPRSCTATPADVELYLRLDDLP